MRTLSHFTAFNNMQHKTCAKTSQILPKIGQIIAIFFRRNDSKVWDHQKCTDDTIWLSEQLKNQGKRFTTMKNTNKLEHTSIWLCSFQLFNFSLFISWTLIWQTIPKIYLTLPFRDYRKIAPFLYKVKNCWIWLILETTFRICPDTYLNIFHKIWA